MRTGYLDRWRCRGNPIVGNNTCGSHFRFDHASDSRTLACDLMPELLLPICSPQFHGGETHTGGFVPVASRIIILSSSSIDWSEFFSGGVQGRRDHGLLFSDYTVVLQAALVGQGVALGWLNVVSGLLANGSLVPAGPSALRTGRIIKLVTARSNNSNCVSEICDWIKAETNTDLKTINARYPRLNLPAGQCMADRKDRPPRSIYSSAYPI